MTAGLRASIVVPTYRRPDLLERCLAALAVQDVGPEAYEIIIADDAALASTREQVERWRDEGRPEIRYLAVTATQGPAGARNAGWRQAVGEIVAFTDDDTIPEPSWLRNGLEALQNADACWGRIQVPLSKEPTDYEKNEAGLEAAEFATANVMCRRAVLEAVGGFDEQFTAAWREDADLFFTLLERGFRVVHAPASLVVHPVRPGGWGISLKQQKKSEFNALLYKKHPGLYRQRIVNSPPWSYYVGLGSLLLAAIGVLGQSPFVVLIGFLGWLIVTIEFCMRRLRGTSRRPSHLAEMAVTSVLIPPLSVFWRIRGALRFGVFYF
jgi:GT2 family glycosyltransferase